MAEAFEPLHDPARDGDWRPPVGIARTVARQVLSEVEGANIHDHDAMLRAATSLEIMLRNLLDALDAERPATR